MPWWEKRLIKWERTGGHRGEPSFIRKEGDNGRKGKRREGWMGGAEKI